MKHVQLIPHRSRHFSDLDIPDCHSTVIPWWSPLPLAALVIALWFAGVL